MTTFVIIVAIMGTAAVVAWFLFQRQHPEQAATHSRPGSDHTGTPTSSTTSERPDETADRPAGPSAETMDPDRLGGDQRPPT